MSSSTPSLRFRGYSRKTTIEPSRDVGWAAFGTTVLNVSTSYVALRVRPRRAFELRWHAHRDRRAGLPGLTDGDGLPASTPFVRELDRHRLEVIESERGQVLVSTGPLRVRQQTVIERIRQVEAAVLDGHPDPMAAETWALRLRELQNARAILSEQIDRHAAAAQHRALRFDEYMHRCALRYTRTLVRGNPDGVALVARGWPVMSDLPAWVLDPRPAAALFAPIRVGGGHR